MPIFYRSDTRPPKVIFRTGFTRRSLLSIAEICNSNVNEFAIRDIDGRIDIEGANVVSITSKFESAPIFPVNSKIKIAYVYAIHIPEQQVPAELLELRENVAYDVHSVQAQNLAKIMSRDYSKRLDFSEAAMVLCAFEFFATAIDPSHIICAVQCTRLNQFGRNTYEIDTYVNPGYLIVPFDRNFFVHREIFNNTWFNSSAALTAQTKQTVIEDFCKRTGQVLMTTPVTIGFAGKTLSPPVLRTVAAANGYAGAFLSFIASISAYVLGLKLLDYIQEKILVKINSAPAFITDVYLQKRESPTKNCNNEPWKTVAIQDSVLFYYKSLRSENQIQKQLYIMQAQKSLELANKPYAIQLHERSNQSKIPRKRFNSI